MLAKYRAGGYGPVGSAEAQQAASDDYAFVLIQSGMGSAQALTAGIKALRDFDANNFGPGTDLAATPKLPALGPNAGTPVGAKAPGLSGGQFGNQRDKWQELEGTAEGRSDLWGEAIRSQYPGASNPFQAFLGRQEDQAFNQYMLQSASGPSHAGDTPLLNFRDYARGGTGQRLSQSQMEDRLGQWGTALSNPDTSGLSKAMLQWLPYMRQGANQFNTAVQSSLGGVAGAARPFFEDAAARSFKDYEVNNPETGGWLNQWLNRGKRFF